MRINMKTVSESDWVLIHATVKKVVDTTLSRGERQKLLDVLARVDRGTEIFQASIGAMGAIA